MDTVLTATPPPAGIVRPADPRGLAKWVTLAFFGYLALLAFFRPVSVGQHATLCALPVLLWSLWRFEEAVTRPWSRALREWTSLGMILVAYWLLEWFSAPPVALLQQTWVEWDRVLLDTLGFRRVIEIGGSTGPAALETVYFFLYAIPAASLGLVSAFGTRAQRERFLLVFLLGTLMAYAMLPLVPVVSPRIAFPDADLPNFAGTIRRINTWVLDHMDISTGVFPSGHVAVAFSSAFGLLSVLRERRWIWVSAFAAGLAVYAATIYGRYHYAVDGLASIVIAAFAWRLCAAWSCDD